MNKVHYFKFFVLMAAILFSGLSQAQTSPGGGGSVAPSITKIATGGYHTCALKANGSLKCWGKNAMGQIGNNSSTGNDVRTPTQVTGLSSGVVDIAAGQNHTCAALSTGGVKCWGFNSDGQLGTGGTSSAIVPQTVSGLSGSATAVAAGGEHSCALLSTGAVDCWGDDSVVQSYSPVSINLSGAAIAIEAGDNHMCALMATGDIECWGSNLYGQLGLGTTGAATAPQAIDDFLSGTLDFSTGGHHTCAITNTGTLKCWGENDDGQAGNAATTMDFVFPYGVAELSSASVDVAAGGQHTCVLLDTDSVQCFGGNYWGELGDGTRTDATAPVTVLGLAAGTITSIDTGDHHSCALFSSTSMIKCWGYNGYGQLGDGSQTDSSTPVSVTGL